jgi:hypothetical protein
MIDQPVTPASNPFNDLEGYSGQDYNRDKEVELARLDPAGRVHPDGESRVTEGPDERDIEPENGRRASFDPVTGELHGSGSREGEEFDEGPKGGSGYKKTGVDGENIGHDVKP